MNDKLFDDETSFVTDLKVRIPKKLIMDVLCTAFEGGSNFWLQSAECTNVDDLELPNGKPYTQYYIHELPLFGAELKLTTQVDYAIKLYGSKTKDVNGKEIINNWSPESLDEIGREWSLCMNDLIYGYKKWCEDACRRQRNSDVRTSHGFELPFIDAGSIDANDADSILQYAVFNEQVFA